MALRVDSVQNMLVQKDMATKITQPSDVVLFNKTENRENVDTFEKETPKSKNTLKKIGLGIGSVITLYITTGILLALRHKHNIIKAFKNFDKLEMFSKLSEEEKTEEFLLLVRQGQGDFFFPTVCGKKPACIMVAFNENKGLLNLEKGLYKDKIDFVHQKARKYIGNSYVYNTFVFNKKETLKVIERNKEIYTQRLGLPDNADIATIYEKLKQVLSVKTNEPLHDIIGLTLGFPKYSSMIFQLEKTGNIPLEMRSCGLEYKNSLHKILSGEHKSYKNPYETLSQEELSKLKDAINKIDVRENKCRPYYQYVEYIDEPEEFNRIKDAVSSFKSEFKELNELITLQL